MTDLLDEDAAPGRPPARSHRRWLFAGAGVVIVAVAVFVLVWFQPQKLIIDDRVDEAIPSVTAGAAAPPSTVATTSVSTPAAPSPTTAPATAPATTVAPPASLEPAELARGEFASLDHGTSGVARVLELADGRRIVRLEGLDTSNGPDLYVYLTANPAGGVEGAFDDDFVDLGRLKGNLGDQNYDLPAGSDLSRYATVLIWCDRFDSAFGAADLTAA